MLFAFCGCVCDGGFIWLGDQLSRRKDVKHYTPRTSSFNTRSLASSTLVPLRSSSFVLSRSLRAVTTTGALVVSRTLLASAKPMPREAGDIKDHGGMLDVVKKSFCYSRNMLQPTSKHLVLESIDDGILAMQIGYAVSG
jgi:hypothetical protein